MYILRDRLSLLREPKISIKQQYREIPWCFMAMQFSFTELASVTGESAGRIALSNSLALHSKGHVIDKMLF